MPMESPQQPTAATPLPVRPRYNIKEADAALGISMHDDGTHRAPQDEPTGAMVASPSTQRFRVTVAYDGTDFAGW